MNARMLASDANLVEELARAIESSGQDLSTALVVFPGKRPAHFLRHRLAASRGESFIPPRILSMDELVDDVYEKRHFGAVTPRLDPIDAVAILHDIQIAAPHPLGGSAFMTLDSFLPVGLKVYNDIEELCIEGVAVKAVADVQPLVEEEVPPRSRERLRSLAHFYEEFYATIESRDFSTRSSRYREVGLAIAEEDLAPAGSVYFVGFYALTRSEKSLLTRLHSCGRVSFLFQDGPGLLEKLDGLPLRGVLPEKSSSPSSPAVHFYASPDTHGQVFALNAVLPDAGPGTLVVLPKPDTLFPLVRHCLSRFDADSYNVSLPYPLQRTPLYGFLNDLMELVGSMDGDRVYLPDYVSFVLHPYVKNLRLGASAEATRVLFHALEERLAAERTRRFATLAEIESSEGLFAEAARRMGGADEPALAAALRDHLADIHARTISQFQSFKSVRDFAERCIRLVSWVHDESTARDHPYFTPFSEAFVRALETIRGSLMAEKSFNDTASYFVLLRRYLQTRYLPFPGTPLHGLQVLGALETRSLSFEKVFILDANEGTFPETGAESTLLPLPVRSTLGLSTYHDQEDIAAYHFALLKAGAQEIHLFYQESGENERSRFVERLIWEHQKAEKNLDEHGIVERIQYRVNLGTTPPQPIAKTPEVAEWLAGYSFSATTLDAYLQCPLRFYYKTVLKLGPREETTGEIEATDIGSFVHDVLREYFGPRVGKPLSTLDMDTAVLGGIIDTAFVKRFGPAVTGANRLLRDQVRRHLGDFLDHYMHDLVSGHRVIVKAVEHDISTKQQGFSLRGRLDVVEERDGKPFLIDYKSSANRHNYAVRFSMLDAEDRATWSAAIPTLQLPFYMLLYAAEAGIPATEIQALFLLLGRTEMDEKIEVPLFDDASEAAAGWNKLDAVIFGLLEEIVSVQVPFTPAPDLRTACARCDFTALCGTAWLKK